MVDRALHLQPARDLRSPVRRRDRRPADIATEVPSVANGGITNGGKTYIFHLRHGVMFQAPVSREVTATDFKYSLERMLNPKMSPRAPAGYLYSGSSASAPLAAGKAAHASGIKVIDPYTLEIDLTQPNYVFDDVMALPFTAVLPRSGWPNTRTAPSPGTRWAPVRSSSTTGAAGQEIVLKRNPNYFVKGHPYLDELKFEFASSVQTALLQLESGQVDVLGNGIPSGQVVQVMSSPTWKSQVTVAPQIAWYYVFMNVHVKPFNNLLVRQAFNYAVDTAKIQKLFYGQAQPLNQVLSARHGGPRRRRPFYTYDPAKAKQLLSQAGYPNGFSVTFYAHNVDPMPKLAQSIQNDLAAIGIKVADQADGRGTVLEPDRTAERQGADRPDRLVHGLPRPVRLDRAAVQQVGGHHRRQRQRAAGGGTRRSRRSTPRASPWRRAPTAPSSTSRCSRSSCSRRRSCRCTSRS